MTPSQWAAPDRDGSAVKVVQTASVDPSSLFGSALPTATGMLYYFGSKERLLIEIVAERDRANAGTTLDTLQSLASLREIGQLNVETATLTRLYVLLGAESFDSDAPLHDFFTTRYETGCELVRLILRAEQERRSVRLDIDVEQVAREVMGVVMGTEIQWLTDPERVDLATTIAAYIDRLVIDLAAPPTRPGPPPGGEGASSLPPYQRP